MATCSPEKTIQINKHRWFYHNIDFVSVFLLFRNYLSLEKTYPIIWTNLNPLHSRTLCAKFGWNWASGSEEKDFLILSMYFRFLVIISPMEEGMALHLNKP